MTVPQGLKSPAMVVAGRGSAFSRLRARKEKPPAKRVVRGYGRLT